MSLAEFVVAKKKAICPICALPKDVRDELYRGRADGIGPAAMIAWLAVEKKVDVTRHKVQNHFENNHQVRADAT